ncbi:MAG: deoxyuridine 5'-triphosphate nucleotidohydrolase [Candidatus Omnitrophica bacterium]|nr:deoxyuridine 5'-triphosphate nucleotidohydrolase [Candidatus Omnitrophota bacterium]
MLNKAQIKQLINKKNLITNYINLDIQLTPNGFDLTAEKIFQFSSAGFLDFSNKERVISKVKEILPKKKSTDKYGWWKLKKGIYKVRTNEIINLPNNLIALAFSRTSILRIGAFTQHGVWDAGFSGKGEFVLVVQNPTGINIKQNARIAQLIFLKIKKTEGYNGIYKKIFI